MVEKQIDGEHGILVILWNDLRLKPQIEMIGKTSELNFCQIGIWKSIELSTNWSIVIRIKETDTALIFFFVL